MIQNISQSRANKAITESDFDNIFGAAWLSVYPGKTLYYDGGYEFGHYARTWIYCVKGLSGGKSSVIWGRFVNCYMHRGATNPSSLHRGILPMNNRYGDINIVQDVVPSTICKNLKIQEGELKIIVENTIYNRADVSKDRSGKSRTPMQAFGTHITTPKKYVSSEAPAEIDYFPSYVIFTPKPGLFDENGPQ